MYVAYDIDSSFICDFNSKIKEKPDPMSTYSSMIKQELINDHHKHFFVHFIVASNRKPKDQMVLLFAEMWIVERSIDNTELPMMFYLKPDWLLL